MPNDRKRDSAGKRVAADEGKDWLTLGQAAAFPAGNGLSGHEEGPAQVLLGHFASLESEAADLVGDRKR